MYSMRSYYPNTKANTKVPKEQKAVGSVSLIIAKSSLNTRTWNPDNISKGLYTMTK